MGRTKGWYWTPDRVVAAMQVFEEIYGRPPVADDFNPKRSDTERWERFHSDGCWPSGMTVIRHWGTWNAALAAAGYPTRTPGHIIGPRHETLKDACVHGHEFTPENTRIRKNGSRICRECTKLARRDSYQRLYAGKDSRARRASGDSKTPKLAGGRPKAAK